jgi:hypothetical protein
MKWEDNGRCIQMEFEGVDHAVSQGTNCGICLDRLNKTKKSSISNASKSAKSRNEFLPNIIPDDAKSLESNYDPHHSLRLPSHLFWRHVNIQILPGPYWL